MKILRLGLTLLMVTSVAGASLAFVYIKTIGKIHLEKEKKVFALQKEIIPEASQFVDLNERTKTAYDTEGSEIGRIISLSSKGYSGDIEILIGIDRSGKVTAVKIVKQSETPGLGSKIAKKDFLTQFEGLIVREIILAKEDAKGKIDAVTGATISSRAVTNGIRQALEKAILECGPEAVTGAGASKKYNKKQF